MSENKFYPAIIEAALAWYEEYAMREHPRQRALDKATVALGEAVDELWFHRA